MPSAEFLKSKNDQNIIPSFSHLSVFLLYACPACKRYTIHKPRRNPGGYWYFDHRLVPVHQLTIGGRRIFVGLAPADSCFVGPLFSMENTEITRTVIRVK